MTFFPIGEIISETARNHSIIIEQKGLKYSFPHTGDDDFIVKGDYGNIRAAFTNLFENAVKYVDENKIIRVSVEKSSCDNEKIRVKIFNSCPGMDERELENLFNEFYKGDKSRGGGKSYGLGLSIVKAVIKAHGCDSGAYNDSVEEESAVIGGITFWFEMFTEDVYLAEG